ncbi:uroporphyrinogen-III synthase [Gluconobacter sp. R71646]|uniref:Uroporphyrinogen-III synthase n=2 Tax=Acetobacteraceae TaxID=433 RepID=A0ABR9YLF3_9PROT|nr:MULTISPECIES: uroporphyrinogen-III synthase [Gluconobacter]MBF0864670.1 uroporphyrinogen-III synthase [Gluconobacter sp. R71656]MBF0866936.1 uroporphyrinogen-III synthase [Gluconobacter sp. R75628]MBF0873187.1 uroporphyrinogen-III synthase [Gluconobacter sp. R75629]MBF0882612.1 uroporphyrinogen-III synthase [Gluconobacter potus]
MAEVRALGWEAVACPMLDITTFEPVAPGAFRAVLVTSANALPALRDWPRDRLVVAVGAQTAARARRDGFVNVEAADGDARALAAFCWSRAIMGADVLLASGEGYGVELAQDLGVQRVEVYAACKRTVLPDDAARALRGGRVDSVLLYSGKTAEAFREALGAEEVTALSAVRALCLSEAIAARLDPKEWRAVMWPDPLEQLGPAV